MGGISRAEDRKRIEYRDVFQYHATPSQIGIIKSRILDLASQCIIRNSVGGEFPYINDPTEKLGIKYANDFRAILYYGSFSPHKKRTIADELTWKWSETTGKFIGCPFWSLDAKSMFDREMDKLSNPYLQDAWKLADCLSVSSRNHNQQLTHEHVFPRQWFCKILSSENINDRNELESLFSRLAVGCVVLESEHRRMPNTNNRNNPWKRYQGIITLAKNPATGGEHSV